MWSTLREGLGLGEENSPVELRGTTGIIERIGQSQALVRLTGPVPGMIYASVHATGESDATASLRAYLFSPDAADYVRREEPAWQDWLQGLSLPT